MNNHNGTMAVLVALVIGILGGIVALPYAKGYVAVPQPTFVPQQMTPGVTPPPVGTPRGNVQHYDSPTVVGATHSLGELVTDSQIIESTQADERTPTWAGTDGEYVEWHVVATVYSGVDFGQIKDSDVTISDDSITVKLPQAAIFTTAVDVDHSQINKHLLTWWSNADPALATRLFRDMTHDITLEAVRLNVCKRAAETAATRLHDLLRRFNVKTIRVQVNQLACTN